MIGLAVVAVAGGVPVGPASAASLPAGSTAILSGAPSLAEGLPAPVGEARATRSSVSRDGRFVAFSSSSDGLVDGDDDRVLNVYVKDVVTGAATLASRETGAAGEPAHADCDDAAISDDGTRVAFTCVGPLDDADGNADPDVYVRDLNANATIVVSRASNRGPVGNGPSLQPSINADGEYVAFSSDARNLNVVAADGGLHVFRRRIGNGDATIVVSRRDASLANAPAQGDEPSISDDGTKIAFTSNQAHPTIDPLDPDGGADVYVRDVTTSTTVLASRAPFAGAAGNGASVAPAIAGDGSAVAFESRATNLSATDPDTQPDVYCRFLVFTPSFQSTVLVDVNAAGVKGVASAPSIDRSGQVVGFLDKGGKLDPADTDPAPDAYVKNLVTGTLDAVSRADGTTGAVANADARAVAVSGDGTKAAITLTRGGITPGTDPRWPSIILRDFGAAPKRSFSVARPLGDAPFVNEGGFAVRSALSADGRFAAFESDARGLGVPDTVTKAILVRDRVTGEVTLASRADGPAGAPFTGRVEEAAISADGRRVAFSLFEGPSQSVWVRDLAEGRTWLASRADGETGTAADGRSFAASLDADGSRVSFTSLATNLGDGDTDAIADVHVRDLDAGRTLLASRGDGAGGAKGNGVSTRGDLDAGGTRVVFTSAATNLGDGDTDTTTDVHLRDLSAQTTRLVSASPEGIKSNGPAGTVSIDAAGARIAFSAVSTNLLGATEPVAKVFVRDLAADTLTLASSATGESGLAHISPDGGYVAFTSSAGDLAPGTPAGVPQVYRRDLAAGMTELVSRRGGTGGAASTRDASAEDISAGGGCVSFRANDSLVAPAIDRPQVYLRVLRADCAAADTTAEGPGPDGGGVANDPGTGGRNGPLADRIAPVLSRTRLSRRRFRVGRAATALSAAVGRGTVLSFRSTEAGTLSVAFDRVLPGRRSSGRRGVCRPVEKRPRRGACVAYRAVGTLTRRILAGGGRVALSGRIGRRALPAGPFRVTLIARDAAGNRSKPITLALTIVKERGR